MSWKNERWPHSLKCRVPVFDDNGNATYDDDGKPVYTYMDFTVVAYEGYSPIYSSDGAVVTQTLEALPYGYRTSSESTSKMNDVAYYDSKLSCPKFYEAIPFGAFLELTDEGGTRVVTLLRKETFNWGCNLFINEVLS